MSNRPRLDENHLKKEILEKVSGDFAQIEGAIPKIKKKHYRIIPDTTITGDAPKELLRIYEYKEGMRSIHNPHLWDLYIVKTGHKWYPYESITEYVLNKIGECLGLNLAESRLFIINGQVRFLSKVFLNQKNELLEHGAELYHGYLDDKEFVESIEKKQLSSEFFTLTFTKEALEHIYPKQAESIFYSFIEMIVFDAIIGNNDRHFYNWGIIKHIHNEFEPKFSPIFDTARGLLWNCSEEKINNLMKDTTRGEEYIIRYVKTSKPKIGVEGMKIKNHFDVIEKLNGSTFPGTRDILRELINEKNLMICHELLMDDMRSLISPNRLLMMDKCLTLRIKTLINILNNDK